MASEAVVGFIDMDCFYVAVETRRDPSLVGLPCAVVQYNARQAGGAPDLPATADRRVKGGSGGIIAVSYEARRCGVTRSMSAYEARKQCPNVILVQVPTAFGKADLRIYKDAGNSVVSLLATRAGACEKRSVDEVAVDITAEADRLLRERSWDDDLLPAARRASHLADSVLSRSAATVSRNEARKGHAGQQEQEAMQDDTDGPKDSREWAVSWGPVEKRLIAGAVVVAELREAVESQLGFSCSGGIAQTKMLAKLGCGLHKPRQQTIVLPQAVPSLLRDLPLDRLPGLGGDLGSRVKAEFNIATASELASIPKGALEAAFPKQAAYLLDLAEGRYDDPVQDRELSKSLSNGKTFVGHLKLDSASQCEYWLQELAGELHQRYIEDSIGHKRAPTTISVSIGVGGKSGASSSRQGPIQLGRAGTVDRIVSAAHACFRRWLSGSRNPRLGVTSLGLSLSGMKPWETSGDLSGILRSAASTARPTAQLPEASTASSEKEIRSACPAAGSELPAKVPGPLARSFAAAASIAPSVVVPAALTATPSVALCTMPPVPAQPLVEILSDSDDEKLGAARPSLAFKNVQMPPGMDPAVLAQLPPDIRAELLASSGPVSQSPVCVQQMVSEGTNKRQRVATGMQSVRGSDKLSSRTAKHGIAQFFQPAKIREGVAGA